MISLCAMLFVLACVAHGSAKTTPDRGMRYFHSERKYNVEVTVFRNGGNNTANCASSVRMTLNTVLEDFKYFKIRAGLQLGYVPADCGRYTKERMRRDDACPPLTEHLLPRSECSYDTWHDGLRVFDARGVMLENLYFVKQDDLLYVVPPGDHFFWHGDYVGRKLVLEDVLLANGSPVVLETLSLEPRLFLIENFVSDDECTRIIDLAKDKMVESRGYKDGKSVKIEARNSQQAWLNCDASDAHKFICDIDQRIASVLRVPLAHVKHHSDPLQVVYYEPDQHYHSHHDIFDPSLHPMTPGLREGYNRMTTLLWYLNEVPAGGETVFPLTGENAFPSENDVDMSSCERGLRVTPKKGAAVLWYNTMAWGNGHEAFPDRSSLHGGCDVKEGFKYAANRWTYSKKWGNRQWVDTELEGTAREVEVDAVPVYPQYDGAEASEGVNADGSFRMQVFNRADVQATIFWDGTLVGSNKVEMGKLDTGGQRAFNTFNGHEWVVEAADGTELLRFVANDEKPDVEIPDGNKVDL